MSSNPQAPDKTAAQASVNSAHSSVSVAQASVISAQSSVNAARATAPAEAQASVNSAQESVAAAKISVDSAQVSVNAAQQSVDAIPAPSNATISSQIYSSPTASVIQIPSSTALLPNLPNGTAATTKTPTLAEKKGLSGGEVAGVAIGMVVLGALIASAVLFLCLRRQNNRRPASTAFERQHAPYNGNKIEAEKGPTVITATGNSTDDFLPQPVEDDKISGELSRIRDNIKNYVRTYYGPEPTTEMDDIGIQDIAATTGNRVSVIARALSNPATRDSVLRSAIGAIILTRCVGENRSSLLPAELSGIVATIFEGSQNNPQLALFSKWKAITGALLQPQFGKRPQNANRAPEFEETKTALQAALAPFDKATTDDTQRRRNLDMILTRAANLAFLLFTQPGQFRLDFASPNGGLTVFPALLQTVDDNGKALNPLKVLSEKEVVSV